MSRTADVHEVQEATDKSNVLRQRKTCWSVQIKTGWMSLNWRLSRQDAHQSRLEGLGGRGHNDSSRQLVPNPNSSREETVVEGIDTPSWNTELTTVSSRILCVWSLGLIPTYFQCITTQLLHHKSWASSVARWTSRVTVWPAPVLPVIHDRSCCTSLNCFNLANVISGIWPPDS